MPFYVLMVTIDSVNHELMYITLQEIGLPEHLIVLLKDLYRDQEVRTEFGEKDI